MTADLRALRDAAATADARCNTARTHAQETQWRAYYAATHGTPIEAAARDEEAELAAEHFLAAMDARDRARRALRDATEARESA